MAKKRKKKLKCKKCGYYARLVKFAKIFIFALASLNVALILIDPANSLAYIMSAINLFIVLNLCFDNREPTYKS